MKLATDIVEIGGALTAGERASERERERQQGTAQQGQEDEDDAEAAVAAAVAAADPECVSPTTAGKMH